MPTTYLHHPRFGDQTPDTEIDVFATMPDEQRPSVVYVGATWGAFRIYANVPAVEVAVRLRPDGDDDPWDPYPDDALDWDLCQVLGFPEFTDAPYRWSDPTVQQAVRRYIMQGVE